MNAHRLLPMDEVLSHIEHFLLPTADDRYLPINRRKRRDYSSSPHARLDHILYQVALADHIRMMQIMYRDSEDEQCLAPELREGDTSVKLPTKHLMEKLSEGRSRIMALCRTCHGEDSLESLRASVDLASSYALQGMWSQVRSHVAIASQQLISKENPSDIEEQHVRQSRGKQAARRVSCCYRVLRSHSLKNRGQIKASFLNELHTELSTIKFDDVVDGKEDSDKEDSALYYATKLTAELHEFFEFFILNKKDGGSPSFEEKENGNLIKTVPSWGDVINYLRDESAVMYVWMRELEVAILPQNKAALHLPFRLCDDQKKGVAHPTQLTTTYMKFSNSLKVISNTNLLKKIKDLKIETPIMINLRNGEMTDPVGEGRSNSDEQENIIRVVYELPVAWEEVKIKIQNLVKLKNI